MPLFTRVLSLRLQATNVFLYVNLYKKQRFAKMGMPISRNDNTHVTTPHFSLKLLSIMQNLRFSFHF